MSLLSGQVIHIHSKNIQHNLSPDDVQGRLRGVRKLPDKYKKLQKLAANLRNNMTDAENKLWQKLRRRQLKGYKFFRQKVVTPYIVDFYCTEAKVIIEVDGSQHYTEEGIRKDQIRDDFLKEKGLKVFRLNNLEVLNNINGVMEYLYDNLD